MAKPYTVSDAMPASLKCSPSEFLASRPHVQRLMGAAMVFRGSGHGRQVLLVRRAAGDSYALKWEMPGGSMSDGEDGSVLDGVRRELREETGLEATRMVYPVGMLEGGVPTLAGLEVAGREEEARNEGHDEARTVSFWEPDERRGRLRWGKVTVVVDVDGEGVVRLDEREHDRWAWATRSEVEAGRWADGEEIAFVSEAGWRCMLEGFRLRAEEEQEQEQERQRHMDDRPRLMAKFGGMANPGP